MDGMLKVVPSGKFAIQLTNFWPMRMSRSTSLSWSDQRFARIRLVLTALESIPAIACSLSSCSCCWVKPDYLLAIEFGRVSNRSLLHLELNRVGVVLTRLLLTEMVVVL